MAALNITTQMVQYPAGVRVFSIPTQWTVKQSWIGSNMTIQDLWGNDHFKAESKFLSFGWNLEFYDLRTGASIGQIKEKMRCCSNPKYTISLGGKEYATVIKEFSCFSQKFTIQTKQGMLTLEGDYMSWSYVFKRNGNGIATVEKVMGFTDTYKVNIQPGEDVILILACCIVIDKCTTNN